MKGDNIDCAIAHRFECALDIATMQWGHRYKDPTFIALLAQNCIWLGTRLNLNAHCSLQALNASP